MVRRIPQQFKSNENTEPRIISKVFLRIIIALICVLAPNAVLAGQYFLGPATGTFTVGSTFDIQVFLNTDNQSVNALDVDIRFPADKIQLVSPKTSVSVIEVWTSQPKFNNSLGSIRLQGGIPRGINVDNALVATLTFRVKSVGNAIIRFGDESKILLNDGLGTNDLRKKGDGLYSLTLPPPAGPTVVSETHPVQGQWYKTPNLILRWAGDDKYEAYSFVLDNSPVTVPDDTSNGIQNSVVYKDLSEGQYYFHIKGLREGVWGGVTHFAVNIDTMPPAEFPIEIIPNSRTSVKDPVIKFQTTDTLSGIDHYEIGIVPLNKIETDSVSSKSGDQSLYIEAVSPYVSPQMNSGRYDVIIRAIDKAGNVREVTERLAITNGFFSWSSREGLIIGIWLITWPWLILILLLLIGLLSYFGIKYKQNHDRIDKVRGGKDLPDNVRKQLEELKRYKAKYGTAVIAFLITVSAFGLLEPSRTLAQSERGGVVELAPPYVTTVSRDVSNNEIFYVGGKTENKDTTVIIYTQNLTTGETTSYEVVSNKKGEWFYRHNSFLTPGSYVIWTQSKIGDIVSPPSPQIEMSVARAALTFGVTRISFETLFGLITMLLLLIVFGLLYFIIYHAYHHKKKHTLLLKEIMEAEESVKRGFAVLKRDLEIEINNLRKAQLSGSGIEEARKKEDELYRDLKDIERRIGKEVWDIEKAETA